MRDRDPSSRTHQERALNAPLARPRPRWLTALVVALAVATVAPQALAQSREDGAPAETLGTGDNAYASVWGPASMFFNPAAMSRARAVIVEGGYSYLEGRSGHGFTAAASDSLTNQYLAMGLAYTYLTGAPNGVDRDGHQLRGALSTAYITPDVGLFAGVGARYLGLTVGQDDGQSGESDDVDAWTVDIGLLLDIASRIRLGVTGANLIDTKSGEAPRRLGLGLGILFDPLEVTASLDVDLTGHDGAKTIPRFGFGAEYTFARAFHARVGYVEDQLLGQQRVSAGFGYVSAQVAFDLGYSSAVSGDTDMLFAVSVRYMPPVRNP
ncbi:MAG: hypothetical protein EP329_02655 [Deltaproteobacteria bacterium]|nr:MAG: hypothetical protein EP329_02655 [Deltaproteobacteria bacterium]